MTLLLCITYSTESYARRQQWSQWRCLSLGSLKELRESRHTLVVIADLRIEI
jgi:hypothetical protein